MKLDTINRIVYYIPIRKLRDAVREYLISQINLDISVWDRALVIKFRRFIKEDKYFFNKYKKLLCNLDENSINVITNIMSKVVIIKI